MKETVDLNTTGTPRTPSRILSQASLESTVYFVDNHIISENTPEQSSLIPKASLFPLFLSPSQRKSFSRCARAMSTGKTYEISGETTEWEDIMINKGIKTRDEIFIEKGLNPEDVSNYIFPETLHRCFIS